MHCDINLKSHQKMILNEENLIYSNNYHEFSIKYAECKLHCVISLRIRKSNVQCCFYVSQTRFN